MAAGTALDLYARFITASQGFPTTAPDLDALDRLATIARTAGAVWDTSAAAAAVIAAEVEKSLSRLQEELDTRFGVTAPTPAAAAAPTPSPTAPAAQQPQPPKAASRFDPTKAHQYTPGGGGTGGVGVCAWCGNPEGEPAGLHVDEGLPPAPEPPPPGVLGNLPPPGANVPGIPGFTAPKHDGSAHDFVPAEWAGEGLKNEICAVCGKACRGKKAVKRQEVTLPDGSLTSAATHTGAAPEFGTRNSPAPQAAVVEAPTPAPAAEPEEWHEPPKVAAPVA
jgi:hypothetical protein